MNNFNKTYKQLTKTYNLDTKDLYLEYQFGDGLKWIGNKISSGAKAIGGWISKIWNIIKKGPAALFDMVKGWFTSAKDEQSTKEKAAMATKLINVCDNKIVSEGISLSWPSWFQNLCGTTKNSISFIKTPKEQNKFLNYIQITCKISKAAWDAMPYEKKKELFSKFTNNELKKNNIVTEDTSLIMEDNALLFKAIGWLVTIIAAIFTFNYVNNNILPITAQGRANKKINDAKAEAKADKETQAIELNSMIEAFKDCEALK